LTQILTTYYAYGVYVIRAQKKKWIECYFVGQQGADVLMESNMLVKMDERLQELNKEAERYGCFEVLDLQLRRFRLVRMLTETEKDEWNAWHHLYRELKWKIKSIEPHQAAAIQEWKDDFSHIQQLAEHLQKNYPVSLGEREALHSLLEDIYCGITEFHVEEGTSKEQPLVEAVEVHPAALLNSAKAVNFIELDEFKQEKGNRNAHPLFLVHDTLKQDRKNVQAPKLIDRKETGDNDMQYENTVLIKPIQQVKEELKPHFSNIYENQEMTEYFQRFYQLSNAIAPLTHTEDTTVQQLLVQLHVELAWIKTKILRALGIHAVYSENKLGDVEFIQLKEGVYANTFQTMMMHSLFDNFGKAAKDSDAAFEAQKNTVIRMLLELFRDEPALSQAAASEH